MLTEPTYKPAATAQLNAMPEKLVSQYTSIGVLVRQNFECRTCTARIGLRTSYFENVIPIHDPYWDKV